MKTAFRISTPQLNQLLKESLFELEQTHQVALPEVAKATGITRHMLYKVRGSGALLGPVSLVTYSRFCSWHDIDTLANACTSPTKHVVGLGEGHANGTILDELQQFLEGGGGFSQAFERGDYATCRQALEVIYQALLNAYKELEQQEGRPSTLPSYSGDGYG